MRLGHFTLAIAVSAFTLAALGQTDPAASVQAQSPAQIQVQPQSDPMAVPVPSAVPAAMADSSVRQLLAFTDTDIKFKLSDLMDILRDHRHEGWVLAAYPDPKTSQPLIGAGFSLDLPARDHPQLDSLNPHPFLEPSSADLWQAAGLDSERLKSILGEFDSRLAVWSKKGFRRRIRTLQPQITDEDANLLMRVGIIQAVYNAKGYCRNFDRLTASQQMALTQLVYQMGVNLQQFSQFLGLINHSGETDDAAPAPTATDAFATDADYWRNVQRSLVQSQWARLYRVRAVAVIAMLDPNYGDAPGAAEQQVGAMLHPAVAHRRAGQTGATRQGVSHTTTRSRSGSTSPHRRARLRRQKKRGV
jgi:hypothetical protein